MNSKDNICISLYRGQELLDQRVGHNIWVDNGRTYLSKLIALTDMDPDEGEVDVRPVYVQLGIGSKKQVLISTINSSPIVDAYPAGDDPYFTTGNEYDISYPPVLSGPIKTLERPIRITGGEVAYPGEGGDVWLSDPTSPRMIVSHPTPYETAYSVTYDTAAPANEILYGSFTEMPLSEVGLFLFGADDIPYPNGLEDFEYLVAYHSFGTLNVLPGTRLEIEWRVQF